MQQYTGVTQDSHGNTQSGAAVTVRTEAGAIATVYSDDGVTTKANPLTTDSNGRYSFKAKDGRYDVSAGSDTEPAYLFDPSAISIINVKSFGAKADGSDATDRLQAAILEAESQVGNDLTQPHVFLYFPGGNVWDFSGLYSTKHIGFLGDDRASSRLRLRAGVTVPAITLTAENIAATSLDDTTHWIFSGIGLTGNRSDTTTQNSAHGIYCPDTSWAQATQYSPSVNCFNVSLESFTGSGMWTGVNRNAGILQGVWSRYNNRDGWTSYGYDHSAVSCAFGNNTNYGVRSVAGGNNKLALSSVFYNSSGVVIDAATDASWKVLDTDINDNQQYGVYASGSGSADTHLVRGNTFWNNSKQTDNTYSDIKSDAVENMLVVHNHFKYGGNANRVKYLVEAINSSRLHWGPNTIPVTGTMPYATSISNLFTTDPALYMTAAQMLAWQDATGATTATIRTGTGTPEGAVTAARGSVFLRQDGGGATTLYVKETGSGNTGWIGK